MNKVGYKTKIVNNLEMIYFNALICILILLCEKKYTYMFI